MLVKLTLILLFVCSCGVAGHSACTDVCEDAGNQYEIQVVNISLTCDECGDRCDDPNYIMNGPYGGVCGGYYYQSHICDYDIYYTCELYARLKDIRGIPIGPERWLNSDWYSNGDNGVYTYDTKVWHPYVPADRGYCRQFVSAQIYDEDGNDGRASTDNHVVDIPMTIDLKNTTFREHPYYITKSVPVSIGKKEDYRAWVTVTLDVRKVGCLVPVLNGGKYHKWSNGVKGAEVKQYRVVNPNDQIDNSCYPSYYRMPVGPMTCREESESSSSESSEDSLGSRMGWDKTASCPERSQESRMNQQYQ